MSRITFDTALRRGAQQELGARRALEHWLSRVIDDQGDADRAVRLLNRYTDALAVPKGRMGFDGRPAGALEKLLREFPAPRRV